MFDSLIGLVAIVVLIAVIVRQQKRLGLIERELVALRSLVLAAAPTATAGTEPAKDAAARQAGAADGEPALPEESTAGAASIAGSADPLPGVDEAKTGEAGPWGGSDSTTPAAGADTGAAVEAAGTGREKRDIETALGTRWAVWVGGIALALGGLFLVRYTIEAGVFGPGVRLAMAAALGLMLVGGGEFVRRTGFKVPMQGAAGAYIPAILTAAGAFILFGAVYAAHGVYGFIGPALAFTLMGAIGVATIAAALVHGQALAGVGLLGSLATPMLVASQAPSPWTLFGYLAIVLAATAVIARMRDWTWLMAAAFTGTGLWMVLYMGDAPVPDFAVLLFIGAATLAVLAFVWLARRGETAQARFDWPSVAPGVFLALSAVMLFVDRGFAAAGGAWPGAVLIAALLGVALCRPRAVALLHAAGAATVLVFASLVPFASISLDFPQDGLSLGGLPVIVSDALSATSMVRIGIVLGLIFIAAGFWAARRFAVTASVLSATWAAWGVAAPLVILLTLWTAYGNLDRDLVHAATAALLLVVFVAGGEWIARAERPPLTGGPAVSFALGGGAVAGLAMLHMAFGSGMTTVLLGTAAIVPALATRLRAYPALGWICVGAAVAVLVRVAFDPTIVGAAFLSRTPVFNWLLAGYGIPALAFGFCAWQLARTTGGRPRLVMEASAALFTLLTLAMLVRHAMHGGVIDAGAPTLAEQAIYTLIALGFGAILVSLDMRSPSSVLRYGSLVMGVLSVLFIAGQHFVALNPLFTDESTGKIPVFNLLFLAYLLPAIAAGGLALYARDKRPRWYSAMLAAVAALLVFAYATLSVRRLFQGEFIGLWSGMEQVETYSYSALWLVMGVALLTLGVRLKSQVLRVASAALISVAVLKVFLFDMSELEGVLRALSFIGLGAVLIGIGLFYQRLLTRAAREAQRDGAA